MSEQIDELLGPQVAIVDNNFNEIQSIKKLLDSMNIGNRFFEVDYTDPDFPKSPISTIELVFLDLYYVPGLNADFDPYICATWLQSIVPANRNYILVVWSNDTSDVDRLKDAMQELSTPMPFLTELKQKSEYQIGDNEYDIKRLLSELNVELKEKNAIQSEEYKGQIIEVEKHAVLINCLIHKKPAFFEVRRFDLKPFRNFLEPKKGMFVNIKITNKPGTKVFEFSEELDDLSDVFKKTDDFEEFKDNSFLIDNLDEDENNV